VNIKRSFRIVCIALVTASFARAAGWQPRERDAVPAPLADHHQHLFSPALAALISPPPPAAPFSPIDADKLIPLLDAAGIRRAATSVALPSMTADQAALIAKRIRQLGLQRIVYGSDAASGGNLTPREGWAEFLKVPLSNAEFRKIATNVPPYMR
jgi:hypothetical protein